jgi:hypothetical protein
MTLHVTAFHDLQHGLFPNEYNFSYALLHGGAWLRPNAEPSAFHPPSQHFGQMECLKLIAGHSFPEKRIGKPEMGLKRTYATVCCLVFSYIVLSCRVVSCRIFFCLVVSKDA